MTEARPTSDRRPTPALHDGSAAAANLSKPPAGGRREFLKTSSLAAAGAAVMPYVWTAKSALADESRSANNRPTLGCIATGDRWKAVGPQAMQFADCVAICDVDAGHLTDWGERTVREQQGDQAGGNLKKYERYQDLLDQDGIDVVTIVTPDHWHTKPVVDALRAGKDIYCEKPLTLTIHEGKQIRKVLEETGRVMQVGTQQRTDFGRRFLEAVALVRQGRVGDVRKIVCCINGVGSSGEIPVADVPDGLNWDLWQGQAPEFDYRQKAGGSSNNRYPASRAHYEFRWWYEYSGGKMTDWGAHHVDIAQWAIMADGPTSVDPLMAEHDVDLEDGMPVQKDRYNVATKFDVKHTFGPTKYASQGVEFHIVSDSPDGNGILFEGTEGRFHVSRGAMKGAPVEALKDNPLPDGALEEVYGGELPDSHMANFFDCVKSRETPISDVPSHHRAMTTCHLSNIAVRLGRRIEWDPQAEQIVGDEQAKSMQMREARSGYEIDVEV